MFWVLSYYSTSGFTFSTGRIPDQCQGESFCYWRLSSTSRSSSSRRCSADSRLLDPSQEHRDQREEGFLTQVVRLILLPKILPIINMVFCFNLQKKKNQIVADYCSSLFNWDKRKIYVSVSSCLPLCSPNGFGQYIQHRLGDPPVIPSFPEIIQIIYAVLSISGRVFSLTLPQSLVLFAFKHLHLLHSMEMLQCDTTDHHGTFLAAVTNYQIAATYGRKV